MNPHSEPASVPSDSDIEDFLAERVTPEGRIPMVKTIREALARFGTRPAAEPVLPDDFISSVKRLAFAARTSGGTAGRDDGLCRALDRVEAMLEAIDLPEWQAMASQRSAAEPSQSGSAGEAELPSPYNIINGVWYYSAEQMRAALSRQAPAAPAAVDFEQWWLAEVAANGGVPIGADYKHWAKAGFELRGDAEAMALLGWTRYEKARKLNPAQWAELHQRNLRGENFDDMIDALPATTQPVQQDTDEPDPWALRFKRALLAIKYNAVSLADAQVIALRALNGFDDSPPAEKQAAPSGEGEA